MSAIIWYQKEDMKKHGRKCYKAERERETVKEQIAGSCKITMLTLLLLLQEQKQHTHDILPFVLIFTYNRTHMHTHLQLLLNAEQWIINKNGKCNETLNVCLHFHLSIQIRTHAYTLIHMHACSLSTHLLTTFSYKCQDSHNTCTFTFTHTEWVRVTASFKKENMWRYAL